MKDLRKRTQYPRNEIRSELAIRNGDSDKYSVNENSIINLSNNEIAIKAKNYNYVSIYAYIMDLICGFITDYRETPNAIYNDMNSRYYKISLKRETVEKYAFGNYTKVKSKFWKAFYKVIAEPKTLVMHTDEGDFLGEPIRILAKLTDGTLLKKNFENLKNATQMIDTVEIEFFKPMFKSIVEDNNNYLVLPPYLQAVIDTELIENPNIAEWKAYSHYKVYESEKLTGQQIRRYFMFMADRNNDTGKYMYIPDIEFWQCVDSYNIQKTKNGYCLRDWNKSKYEIDALANFHSILSHKGLLQGMNFTTCKSYYEKNESRYRIAVYREKPLENAPQYMQIEYDMQNEDDGWYEVTDYEELDKEWQEYLKTEEMDYKDCEKL